jgi:hypothetical protein
LEDVEGRRRRRRLAKRERVFILAIGEAAGTIICHIQTIGIPTITRRPISYSRLPFARDTPSNSYNRRQHDPDYSPNTRGDLSPEICKWADG